MPLHLGTDNFLLTLKHKNYEKQSGAHLHDGQILLTNLLF